MLSLKKPAPQEDWAVISTKDWKLKFSGVTDIGIDSTEKRLEGSKICHPKICHVGIRIIVRRKRYKKSSLSSHLPESST